MQLQEERRIIQILEFGAAYIRDFRVLENVSYINGMILV